MQLGAGEPRGESGGVRSFAFEAFSGQPVERWRVGDWPALRWMGNGSAFAWRQVLMRTSQAMMLQVVRKTRGVEATARDCAALLVDSILRCRSEKSHEDGEREGTATRPELVPFALTRHITHASFRGLVVQHIQDVDPSNKPPFIFARSHAS
jgi:hypothetical protein